jgi:hypothetical protein
MSSCEEMNRPACTTAQTPHARLLKVVPAPVLLGLGRVPSIAPIPKR